VAVSDADFAWKTSRMWIAPLARTLTHARGYGLDRIPITGGCVLAINHLAWIDIPLVGGLSPRNIDYVAKVELRRIPLVGRYLEWHGVIAVRRGESDRDAVRQMLARAEAGRAIGLFVEGTRMKKTKRPGTVQPGAAMVGIQANVPVVPIGVYGTQFWTLGNLKPCSVAVGEPFLLEGYPKGGKGYREASLEIERRLNVLFDWLAGVHARGRPPGEIPPI
jgi:1-acyl-sn-glycerol-3-phosphate acyltransferase